MPRIHLSCKRQSIAKWGYAKRAPENRNEVRFLGRGGAECACEHCPKGRCERAADCSDEGALTEKRGFRTRNLIIEKVLRQKCHFATRNLIIGKEIPYVVLSEAAGFLPVILSVAKRSRRISILILSIAQ